MRLHSIFKVRSGQENFFTIAPSPCKSVFFDSTPFFPKYNSRHACEKNSAAVCNAAAKESAAVNIPSFFCRLRRALALSLFSVSVLCLFVFFSQTGNAADGKNLSIALILESGVSDHGAADMLKGALKEAAAKHGAAAEVIIADPDKCDQTDVFRKAAAEHSLVIIAEGRLHEILRDNAAAFPKTMFGCIDTGVRNRNIMSVTFEDNEPAYIAGALAGELLDPATKVGWLQAEKTPMLNNMYKAFSDGLQLSHQGPAPLQMSAGFNKPLAEADALRRLEEKGCSVVVIAGGYGQRGAWNAAGTTRALLVGMDQDQSSQAPGRVPFSIIKRFDRALMEIVDSAASGHFRAKDILVYTLANGGVDIQLSADWAKDHPVSKKLSQRISDLRHEITAGHIKFTDLRDPTLCDCLD